MSAELLVTACITLVGAAGVLIRLCQYLRLPGICVEGLRKISG
jgi:hypothetical protein